MSYSGKQIFMETLMVEGVRYIFGNPGTTELPVMDSLNDYPDIDYVLCLQEAVAVSMADAYALATDTVGVVNLHVAPGLGNGLGSVYNAWEGGTPLLVTAGQQDSRLRLREPMLGHDLVAMAAPLTKWSVEAHSADELPLILNRAFKIAREAPSGPVFVSLPLDVMEQRTEHPPMPASRLFDRPTADARGLAEAAEILARGARDGDRLRRRGRRVRRGSGGGGARGGARSCRLRRRAPRPPQLPQPAPAIPRPHGARSECDPGPNGRGGRDRSGGRPFLRGGVVCRRHSLPRGCADHPDRGDGREHRAQLPGRLRPRRRSEAQPLRAGAPSRRRGGGLR